MRALATFSVVTLLGTSLAGCDIPGSHQQQVAVAPAPCNCTTTPPATMTPPPAPTEHLTRLSYAPRHRYYGHRYYAEARYRHAYHGRYDIARAQQPVDAYDYVSSSRVTRREYPGGYESGHIVWVDGYGRGYFSNGPVTVAATMRGRRLDPYHGYDADCPDDGEPR